MVVALTVDRCETVPFVTFCVDTQVRERLGDLALLASFLILWNRHQSTIAVISGTAHACRCE